jgi:hypothetical protein
MRTLVTMTLSVAVDGDDYHVSDSTQTHGNSWADVYRGLTMIRDEVQRQIDSRRDCPFNPARVRRAGEPVFAALKEQNP